MRILTIGALFGNLEAERLINFVKKSAFTKLCDTELLGYIDSGSLCYVKCNTSFENKYEYESEKGFVSQLIFCTNTYVWNFLLSIKNETRANKINLIYSQLKEVNQSEDLSFIEKRSIENSLYIILKKLFIKVIKRIYILLTKTPSISLIIDARSELKKKSSLLFKELDDLSDVLKNNFYKCANYFLNFLNQKYNVQKERGSRIKIDNLKQ